MSDHELPEPKDLGQAILLLSVLGQRISGLTTAINTLREEMATRRELHQVRDELTREIESIRKEVRGASATSILERFSKIAQQLAVIAAVFGGIVGGAIALVHFWDRIK